jgi:hypothetical protein
MVTFDTDLEGTAGSRMVLKSDCYGPGEGAGAGRGRSHAAVISPPSTVSTSPVM